MLKDMKLTELISEISAKSPAPGGGSASALIGAIGCALMEMVCNLTIGKKKYKEHEPKVKEILNSTQGLKNTFIELIDEDTEAFMELFKFFKMKELTPEQEQEMRKAEERCIQVPSRTMETSLQAMELAKELAPICNKNAISDIGCAIEAFRSSFNGAQLNVRINLAGKEEAQIIGTKKWLEDSTQKMHQLYTQAIDPVQLELGM